MSAIKQFIGEHATLLALVVFLVCVTAGVVVWFFAVDEDGRILASALLSFGVGLTLVLLELAGELVATRSTELGAKKSTTALWLGIVKGLSLAGILFSVLWGQTRLGNAASRSDLDQFIQDRKDVLIESSPDTSTGNWASINRWTLTTLGLLKHAQEAGVPRSIVDKISKSLDDLVADNKDRDPDKDHPANPNIEPQVQKKRETAAHAIRQEVLSIRKWLVGR